MQDELKGQLQGMAPRRINSWPAFAKNQFEAMTRDLTHCDDATVGLVAFQEVTHNVDNDNNDNPSPRTLGEEQMIVCDLVDRKSSMDNIQSQEYMVRDYDHAQIERMYRAAALWVVAVGLTLVAWIIMMVASFVPFLRYRYDPQADIFDRDWMLKDIPMIPLFSCWNLYWNYATSLWILVLRLVMTAHAIGMVIWIQFLRRFVATTTDRNAVVLQFRIEAPRPSFLYKAAAAMIICALFYSSSFLLWFLRFGKTYTFKPAIGLRLMTTGICIWIIAIICLCGCAWNSLAKDTKR